MKKVFSAIFLFGGLTAFAQPKIIRNAVINTNTTVVAPEEQEVQNIQQDQRGGMNFRNMLDGETKFTTYLKGDLVKTVINAEMGRSTVYRDNNKKLTTTLMEMMGNKMGFYVTDDEQAEMQRKRDSMFNERRKKDTSLSKLPAFDRKYINSEIVETGESKKIAGYTCKKAFIISSRFPGVYDTAIIWYTQEFKVQNLSSTGGFESMSGFMGNMAPSLNSLDKIDGFVMSYQIKMRRNRLMNVEVTKVELEKQIDDKEFKIPADFDIKPMKEMRGMFGGERGMMRPPAGRD